MSTEKIKEYIGTQLKALTSIASPTGFTKNATDYLMKQLEAMGYAPQLQIKEMSAWKLVELEHIWYWQRMWTHLEPWFAQ